MNWSPTPAAKPTDPFKDDDLHAPPTAPADARNVHPNAKNALVRTRLTAADSVLTNRVTDHRVQRSVPAYIAITDESAEPRRSERVVQHISFETQEISRLPKNPLRSK